jgi:hypothetical protein
MTETADLYAEKIARARRRHGKPFKALTRVERVTPPSMVLKHLTAMAPPKKKHTASKAAPPAVLAQRRVGGNQS